MDNTTIKTYTSIKEYPIPASYLVENDLLGSLISNPSYISKARKHITGGSFADAENGKIWKTLCELDDKNEAIDEGKVFSLSNADHFSRNILPHCKGASSFAEVYDKMNNLWQIDMRRKAYFCATKMLNAVNNGTAADALDIAQRWAEEMESQITDTDTRRVADAINDLAATLEARQADIERGKPLRIPTSFKSLDFITYGGFANGNLVILAARPSVGKTAIALQMARAAALNRVPALVFSLEMTNGELVQRMIRSCSDITGYQLAMGQVDWQKFEEATGKFVDLPLWFNDKASYFDDISTKIQQAVKAGQCSIVFIDYLGLISYRNESASLYQQISAATKKIKRLAKDCDIPIVLLCQLNRDNTREGRAPELHDLRDSGSIEQDADIVLMLDRELSADVEVSRGIRMFVRKNRQGRAGDCILLEADDSFCNFNEKTATL